MGITIQKNFGDLANIEWVTADDMRELGLQVREDIVRRTARGVDVRGEGFKPYSESYAKEKREALGTSAVNLQVSGNMLNDLTIADVQGWSDGDGPRVKIGWSK